MRISNFQEYRDFCSHLPQDTIYLRFSELYDFLQKFCGGCRVSDKRRALDDLERRYRAAVVYGPENYVEAKNTIGADELLFLFGDEELARY